MKFYILDDLIKSVKSLSNIIETKNLGEIIGSNTDSEIAVHEILSKKPDIVIIDLLMPVKDGITVVKEVLEVNPDISFVMVSQVVDKHMISDAYDAGIEFFITKPNNVIEIEKVITSVIEKRKLRSMLNGIKSVIEIPSDTPKSGKTNADSALPYIKQIISAVGMLGENGTKDIINVFEYLQKSGQPYDSKTTLNDYAASICEDPKIVKQRIRRAIKKGLTNIAALGIEDYYSDAFESYSNVLFNFDAVRLEMDLLRGKSEYGGRPSIDTFFEGLEILCEKK